MIRFEPKGQEEWTSITTQLSDHSAAMFAYKGPSPQAFSTVTVTICHSGTELGRANGQVINVVGEDVVVAFDDEQRDKLLALRFSQASSQKKGATPVVQVAGEEQPLWLRYETLTKGEKISLARRGDATARRLVLRDRDQTLHLHVLDNPRLTASELAGLIRTGAANRQFFDRIIQNQKLMNNPAVVDALVKNPHTPIKVAVGLVAKLQLETVRRIAKTGNLRQEIVRAARKRVITK